MEPTRRNPDSLLQTIQETEKKSTKGKLRIFFGMCAGVGKTFSMLKEAIRLQQKGTDVVIGYVETHERIETDEMSEQLPQIPLKRITHQNITLKEMDLDAILERKPALVIVDELAHTNAIGLRHRKRYMDVLELLEKGIDVYTTLNIQHVESQADVVENFTEIKVRERLPDSVLEQADEITIIDLNSEELRKRLLEGKVYLSERVESALSHFFKMENLIALREMTLKFTARLVDYKLTEYKKTSFLESFIQPSDRLLVMVFPDDLAGYLIRLTRRMAFNLHAPWYALTILKDTYTEEEKNILGDLTRLIQQLGGEVISSVEDEPLKAIMGVVKNKNITQLFISHAHLDTKTSGIFSKPLFEQLRNLSCPCDIHVTPSTRKVQGKTVFQKWRDQIKHVSWVQVSALLTAIFFITILSASIFPFVDYLFISMIYFVTILIFSFFIRMETILIGAVISAFTWNYFFIPPYYTFAISKGEDWVLFFMYFIAVSVTSYLNSKLRYKEKIVKDQKEQLKLLYDSAVSFGQLRDLNEIARNAKSQIKESLKIESTILLLHETQLLVYPLGDAILDSKEMKVAYWVSQNKKAAGQFSDTLPDAQAYYLPLMVHEKVVGVLGLHLINPIEFRHKSFIHSLINLVAISLEREMLAELSKKASMIEASEKLYQVLFNSISHELRTPLTVIQMAIETLDTMPSSKSSPKAKKSILNEMTVAVDRLDRLIENLLNINRMESGMLKLNREYYEVAEVIQATLHDLRNEVKERTLQIIIPDEPPLIYIDFILFKQVLFNLLFNAISYTPAQTPITLECEVLENQMVIHVRDQGPGLEDVDRIFEKFYRGSKQAGGGSGLGLNIVKGIMTLHQGEVQARNMSEGGAEFTISLPLRITDHETVMMP